MDQVAQVKEKTDIVAIIGEHLELKKAGKNFKARCPFHEEKSASFVVSPEMQIYKCFGCGESGDVLTFLQKYEGLDFPEALKLLADRAGITLKKQNKRDSSKDKPLEINALASKYYNYILISHPSGKEALNYLKNTRKISLQTIKLFNLGYAPNSPKGLVSFLHNKKGYALKDIELSGLAINPRGEHIDRFRERIIFPINDHRGVTIALAGRTLPGDNDNKYAKYINSPETPIYHKSNSLYGIDLAKDHIRESKLAVIVEGEIDLLSSYQTGIKNTVAIKGSALTPGQIRLISRFTGSIVLALDSDFAGDKAAISGIKEAHSAGLEVKVAKLGKYKDPDEFALNDPNGLRNAISNAVEVWDFIFGTIFANNDVSSGEGKRVASKEIIPILSSIQDKIVQAHYIALVANKLGVSPEAVTQELQNAPVPTRSHTTNQVTTIITQTLVSRSQLLEERLISLSINLDPQVLLEEEISILIDTPKLQKIITHINKYQHQKDFEMSGFLAILPSEFKDIFTSLILKLEDQTITREELDLTISELKTLKLKDKLAHQARKISDFERQGDKKGLIKAQQEFTKISASLSQFSAKSSGYFPISLKY